MKAPMTKAEARAYRARWAAVNLAERRELQATSMEKKAKQLAALMESVHGLGWKEAPASEEIAVRERWNELRRVSGK